MSLTPEQVRFHAAGHLSAALILVEDGQPSAARAVLSVVDTFANHPMVNAPPALKQKLSDAVKNPAASGDDIRLLEGWFVHPMNTVIEKSGA